MKKFLITILLAVSVNSAHSQFKNVSEEQPEISEPQNIDVRIFRSINNIESRFLDRTVCLNDKSLLAASVISPVALFGLSRTNGNVYDENSALLLGASEFTALASSQIIKRIISRERPYKKLSKVLCNIDNSITDEYSFPSSHTALAFSMATSLTYRYSDDPLFVAGLFTYATTVSFGRIYLGVHYPSDVLAGMLVGVGSGILVNAFSSDLIKFKNNVIDEHKPDVNNKKSLSAPVVFGAIIATDIFNLIFSSSENKILNNSHLSISSTGFSNNVNFQYNF